MRFFRNKTFGLNLFIVVMLLIGGFFLVKHLGLTDNRYEFGSTVKELVFFDHAGIEQKINAGLWHLVILVKNLEENHGFIKYVDYLYTHRFKDLNLHVLIFSISSEDAVDSFTKNNSISTSILPAEQNAGNLDRLFGTIYEKRAVMLIGPSREITFVSDFIQENDVRQVLEKFLLGDIAFNKVNSEKPGIGDSFPSIEVVDLENGEELVINKSFSPHLWFVFTSNCISCVLKSHLLTFSILEDSLLEKINLQKGLIFSSHFNMNEISLKVNEFGIRNPVFLAKSELQTMEDPYYRGIDDGYKVLVVITDNRNSIVYVDSFSNFAKQIKGDYFEKKKFFFN